MYVEESGRLFVNIFDPRYPEVKDFLVSCCEPVSRTHNVNEYRMSRESLSAAAAEGTYTAPVVRKYLAKYGIRGEGDHEGFEVPPGVAAMVDEQERCDRLRLVLGRKHGSLSGATKGSASSQGKGSSQLVYYLVSSNRAFLESLIKNNQALQSYVEPTVIGGVPRMVVSAVSETEGAVSAEGPSSSGGAGQQEGSSGVSRADRVKRLAIASRSEITKTITYQAQVREDCLRDLRQEVQENMGFPIDCYYDFNNDEVSPPVPNFTLKGTTKLRPYQEASLERFQRGGKAHNGVVVLPCGAGKTLTGIAASSVVGKRTIVMCINVLSVLQWRDQFLRWTNLKPHQVTICTKDVKQMPGGVFITTYAMLTARQREFAEGEQISEMMQQKRAIMDAIKNASWGLLLLDEVHVAPARSFQLVVEKVKHHCVLGLTATLLREDMKVDDLRFLVGPKLYEANWLELTSAGHLAKVECAEVRCPLPAPMVVEYLQANNDRVWGDLECINPTKLWVTQALIKFHESRTPSDKIIIFCDSRPAIKYYAHKLGVPFMDGDTPDSERVNLLTHFRWSTDVNTIILSRVGDIALDLPEATVIIQLSGLWGSRRQEAQRLGRILRPKPPSLDNMCAYFYTLVSLDTDETRHAFSRQEWLRDQGFSYRVLQADDVLGRFLDAGHMPVCIGPPAWCHRTAEGTVVGWHGFSDAVSVYIEKAFLRGDSSVTLTELKGAKVRFDCADLPHSHGVVEFKDGSTFRVRRGNSDPSHSCGVLRGTEAQSVCLRHALSKVGERPGEDRPRQRGRKE